MTKTEATDLRGGRVRPRGRAHVITMTPRRMQTRDYYVVRDALHRLDPGLDVRTVSQLARAVLRDGLVRVRETVRVELVDRDGRPFVEEAQ